MAAAGKAVNIQQWVDENKASFVPPVCNKLMHGHGQLKIMFVGGPNQRADYHIEEGEELFYQLKGDMLLKVMEKGVPRDIPIKEGEVYVLPSRIPHSPQRFEDTVGLVIERERAQDEVDGLRYYQPKDATKPLWERWFHCFDLGKQLGPVIKEYFASKAHETGVPQDGDVADTPKVEIDTTNTAGDAMSLNQWLDEHAADAKQGAVAMYDKGEFKVHAVACEHKQKNTNGQLFVWHLRGKATATVDGGELQDLTEGASMLAEPGQEVVYTPADDGLALFITMDPAANKA